MQLPGPLCIYVKQMNQLLRGATRMRVAQRPGCLAFLLAPLIVTLAFTPVRPETAPFNEASLQELLQKNPATGRPVDSIKELMPLLPQELRANFTFVYDSRSPFHSSISPEYPRVILFAPDGRLVLTFTGDEGKPGFDLLESMSFDDNGAKFELHPHLLPAAKRRGWRPSAAATNCSSCHGSDPRPIFDSYPLWPGFYGSVQDTFFQDRIGAKELENYLKFLGGAAKTGVYKNLDFPAASPVSPYLDPRAAGYDTVTLDPSALKFLPNTRLGMALSQLNRARIYRKLKEGKSFSTNEKRLLARLLECEPTDSPSDNAVLFVKDQLARENAERQQRLGLQPEDIKPARNNMQELRSVRALAEVDWVSNRAGADRSDWSMALEPGSLAFFDGILSGIYEQKSYYLKEGLIFEILSHLSAREPFFRPYFATENAFAKFGYPFINRIDMGKALESCHLLSIRQ